MGGVAEGSVRAAVASRFDRLAVVFSAGVYPVRLGLDSLMISQPAGHGPDRDQQERIFKAGSGRGRARLRADLARRPDLRLTLCLRAANGQ